MQQFSFGRESRYKSIVKGDSQEKAMDAYGQEFEIPLYYLLYNPAVIPWTTQLPVHADTPQPTGFDVGARVVPAMAMRNLMRRRKAGDSPSYADLEGKLPAPFKGERKAGWSIESFFVDELCQCREGKIITSDDEALFAVFNRRSGPISGAIAINISAPDGFDWGAEPEKG